MFVDKGVNVIYKLSLSMLQEQRAIFGFRIVLYIPTCVLTISFYKTL